MAPPPPVGMIHFDYISVDNISVIDFPPLMCQFSLRGIRLSDSPRLSKIGFRRETWKKTIIELWAVTNHCVLAHQYRIVFGYTSLWVSICINGEEILAGA